MLFNRVSDPFTLDAAPDFSLLQENRSTASQIRELAQALKSLDARINPSSRLFQYASMLEGDDDTATLSLDQALLESLQFLAIRRALCRMDDPSPWLPTLSSA